MVEKLALSLVHAARRLRPYFQNHTITVKTDYPIQKILQKPDLAGRMSSWAVELSEFNIRYEPYGPIKAQCLLDFVNDLQQTISMEHTSNKRYSPCKYSSCNIQNTLGNNNKKTSSRHMTKDSKQS